MAELIVEAISSDVGLWGELWNFRLFRKCEKVLIRHCAWNELATTSAFPEKSTSRFKGRVLQFFVAKGFYDLQAAFKVGPCFNNIVIEPRIFIIGNSNCCCFGDSWARSGMLGGSSEASGFKFDSPPWSWGGMSSGNVVDWDVKDLN